MVQYGEAGLAAQQSARNMIERFKAVEAASPESILSGSQGGLANLGIQSGATAEEQLRHFNGWPFAAISTKARTIAGQPFRVGRRKRKPRRRAVAEFLPAHLKSSADQIDVLDDHDLLKLMTDPNRLMTEWHAIYVTVACLELTGKAHWWITRDPATGKRTLWPIPTSWINPDHTNGAFSSWKVQPFGATAPFDVPAEEIVYFYYPNPSDPLGAKSPTAATMLAILADEKMEASQQAMYDEGIIPRFALVAGDISGIGDENNRPLLMGEQRDQLYSLIRQHHANMMRRGDPLILDAMVRDIKTISNKPLEMDFMGSGKVTKDRITQTYGVNPVVMGQVERVNLANSLAGKQHLADFTVNPMIDMLSMTLQKRLAPIFGARGRSDLVVWIEPYQPEQADARRKDVETLQKGKAISRSEQRAQFPALGLSDDDAYDDVVMTSADVLVPVKEFNRMMLAVHPNHRAVTTKEPVPVPPAILAALTASALDVSQSQRIPSEPAWRTDVKQRWIKAVSRAEADTQDALEAMFAEQGKELAKRLRASGIKAKQPTDGVLALVDQLFDKAHWDDRLKETMRPLLLQGMVAGARSEVRLANQQLGRKDAASDPAFVDLDPATRAAIDAELDTVMKRPYWTEIHQTVKSDLARTLQAGIDGGESIYQLGARIEDDASGMLGGRANTVRARRIVRTEMGGAVNAGHFAQQTSYADEGLIEKKQWLSIIDFTTRQEIHADHVVMDGTVEPVAGLYTVAGSNERAPYPLYHGLSAAQRANCRCTSVGVYVAA